MKNVEALLLVGFAQASALAGIVTFEPGTIDLCTNDPGCTGFPTEGTFDVTVTPQELVGGFNSADILIGTDDLGFAGFEYGQAWIDATLFQAVPAQFVNVYKDSLLVGGFGLDPIQEVLLGTLTVMNKGKLVSTLSEDDAKGLIARGVIQGGMLPKVEAMFHSLLYGVKSAHIINGNDHHAIIAELFTDKGIGTIITG